MKERDNWGGVSPKGHSLRPEGLKRERFLGRGHQATDLQVRD